MIKGQLYYERESSRLNIPEAYIIDQLNEPDCPVYEQPELHLPETYRRDTMPLPKESSSVIIIEI